MPTIANGKITIGKLYYFKNKAFPNYALNVWSSNAYPAKPLSNVCLWEFDSKDQAQMWAVTGSTSAIKFVPICNTALYLDRYTGSGSGATINAHLYTYSSTADFTISNGTRSDTIRIRAVDGGKVLTAYSGANGKRDGKTAKSIGNVYFADSDLSDARQEWIPVAVSSSSGGETGTVIGVTVPDGTYDESQTQQEYPWTDGNYNVSKDKFHSSGCSAMSATYAARIVKNNVSIKPEDLFSDGIFGSSDGYPSANWGTSETYGVTYTKKVKGRSDSAILADVYNQLSAGKPIIVVLANKKVDYSYTHFVLAYELESGTTSSNITQSKVKILDPWTTKNTTLEQATSYTSKWAALLNTVFVS